MKKKPPLRPNTICRIRSLGKDQSVARRLAHMGIFPGIEVTILRVGPLGSPLEMATTSGQAIALRENEVKDLECEVVAMPLSSVGPGEEEYRIRALRGGSGFLRKMADHGIKVNTIIRIETGPPFKARILPNGQELTIGSGEAEKIVVELV